MAKKNKRGDESEEEKKDQFTDDDFGLPDLEYDELDEGEDEFEDEMEIPDPDSIGDSTESNDDEVSANEDAFKSVESDIDKEEVDANEDDLDDISMDDIDVDDIDLEDIDLEDIDIEDIDMDDIDISDEDLEKELAEIERGDVEFSPDDSPSTEDASTTESAINEETVPEETEFYEEEVFDEFNTEVGGSIFDADSKEKSTSSVSTPTPAAQAFKPAAYEPVTSSASQKKSKGNFTKIVFIGSLVFTAIAIVLILAYNDIGGPATKKPVVEVEKPVVKPEPKVEEPKKEVVVPKVTKPSPGTITRLSDRKGNSYVIVGSFIDEDLAVDYANKLATQGKSPYLMPRFSNHRFFRVAISEYPSFSAAQNDIGKFKAEFGNDIWVIRY